MQIIPTLHFNRTCEKAIDLYQRAFGCTVKCLLYYSDAVKAGWIQADSERMNMVYHSEILFGEQEVRMSDCVGEASDLSQEVFLTVKFEKAEQVEQAFNILKEKGTVIVPLERPPYCEIVGSVI